MLVSYVPVRSACWCTTCEEYKVYRCATCESTCAGVLPVRSLCAGVLQVKGKSEKTKMVETTWW